jgi:hypothetical protein
LRALFAVSAFVVYSRCALATETIYFLVGCPRDPDWVLIGDTYVVPLSKPDDIDHARYLIWLGKSVFSEPHAALVNARIGPGKDGINRNYLDPTLREWSWHVVEFNGFYDVSAEILDGSATDVENQPAWYSGEDGRQGLIEFWVYTIVRELGPRPLPLSITPDGPNFQFYWGTPATNYVYTLEGALSPGSTNWLPIPGGSWPLATNHWVLPRTDPPTGFFRVRAEPALTPQDLHEDLPFRTLARGSVSGITVATNLVIRTESQWAAVWRWHQSNGEPKTTPPAVDFKNEMVVGALMGLKPTGGYEIDIQRIEPSPTGVNISINRTLPGPDSTLSQAYAAPFHFVAACKTPIGAPRSLTSDR